MVTDFRARLVDWQTDPNAFTLTPGTPHHPGKTDIDEALSRITQQLAVRDSFAFIEALLSAKNDWLDASEDINDLVNFYKTQISTWRKLLDGLSAFADNREALEKVPQAATALSELVQIRDNARPYGLVSRIEPLVATVTVVNEQLAQEKRDRALASIDEKLAEVQAKLSALSASPDVSNKALSQLQEPKVRIASQTSIAQILYLQGQAGDAMDDAITLIEASIVSKSPAPPEPGGTKKPAQIDPSKVPPSPVKTTKVVKASEFSTKTYLETEADVDAYINKLKEELLTAVRSGQIARIQ